jgi:hypothetical protein
LYLKYFYNLEGEGEGMGGLMLLFLLSPSSSRQKTHTFSNTNNKIIAISILNIYKKNLLMTYVNYKLEDAGKQNK